MRWWSLALVLTWLLAVPAVAFAAEISFTADRPKFPTPLTISIGGLSLTAAVDVGMHDGMVRRGADLDSDGRRRIGGSGRISLLGLGPRHATAGRCLGEFQIEIRSTKPCHPE